MRKKARSAKQKANDRRLGQLAKARFKKRRTRTVSRMVKRKVKRSKKRGLNPIKLIIPSIIYGATREKISSVLLPLTSKIPLGNIGDELVLGTMGYFVAKKVKNPTLKGIGQAMVVVESARIGEALISEGLSGLGPTVTTSTTNSF